MHRLEENHGILTHMAEKENDSEASSALPKLLLELVSQMDENEETENGQQNNEIIKDNTAPKDDGGLLVYLNNTKNIAFKVITFMLHFRYTNSYRNSRKSAKGLACVNGTVKPSSST